MKKLFTLIFVLFVFGSCVNHEYKYKLEGNVRTKDGLHPSIAYTDTFQSNIDSVWYFNSNGSKVTILKPYKIIKNCKCKHQTKKDDDDGDMILVTGNGVIIF